MTLLLLLLMLLRAIIVTLLLAAAMARRRAGPNTDSAGVTEAAEYIDQNGHRPPQTMQNFDALGPEIILVHGLVKFVPAVAYHFFLNLPATFSQPRASIISGPSIQGV